MSIPDDTDGDSNPRPLLLSSRTIPILMMVTLAKKGPLTIVPVAFLEEFHALPPLTPCLSPGHRPLKAEIAGSNPAYTTQIRQVQSPCLSNPDDVDSNGCWGRHYVRQSEEAFCQPHFRLLDHRQQRERQPRAGMILAEPECLSQARHRRVQRDE